MTNLSVFKGPIGQQRGHFAGILVHVAVIFRNGLKITFGHILKYCLDFTLQSIKSINLSKA